MENITITIPAELKPDVDKLVEAFEAEQKSKPFPQIGDKYEFINGQGSVITVCWKNSPDDQSRLRFNNVYPVCEAPAVADQMWARAKIARYIAENGIENKFMVGKKNYFLQLRHGIGLEIDWSCVTQEPQLFYVRTSEIAQQIIDAVGADTIELAIRGRVGE